MGVQTIKTVITPPASYALATLAQVKAQLGVPSGTNYVTSADVPSGQVLPFLGTAGIALKSSTDGSPTNVAGPNIQTGTVVAAVTPTTVTLSLPVTGDVPAGSVITFGNDQLLDIFLTDQISKASWAIQKHCDRVFGVQTLQDQVFPQRDDYPGQVPGSIWMIQLSEWPVLVATLPTNAAAASGDVLNFASTAGLVAGMAAVQANIPDGTLITAVGQTSVTLSQPIAAAVASGSLVYFAPGVTVQTAPGSVQTLTPNKDYLVKPQSGQLMRLNPFTGTAMDWDAWPTTVTYTAGYATLPGDLTDACIRMVTKMFWNRGRDPSIMEQAQPAGTTRYWVDDNKGGNLPPDIEDLLESYRVPVVG